MSTKNYHRNPDQRDLDVEEHNRGTWQVPSNDQHDAVRRYVSKAQQRPGKRKPTALDQWEQRAWISFYRNIGDPIVAAEVIRLLDSNGDVRSEHLGLYMQAKRSIRLNKQRQLREERIAAAVRICMRALFIAPWVAIIQIAMRTVRFVGNVLVACTPDRVAEPAERRLHELRQKGGFAEPAETKNVAKSNSSKSTSAKSASN
ncbi:hypothetical protein [Janthinobacterium sp. NKUCC06_STL]|uniref:hypothetical protein n=1 Tax=Janthinobacterium sp. NKUCC06_STL TaxID=2842127 RepID=UPI001C5A6A73|nr:hypothetical protein [Janthinobacterium sp. NKUCC06_STL]MBW3512037.1 hypothetical protein [Janthinobacterium sp. NKUCC06_STL]